MFRARAAKLKNAALQCYFKIKNISKKNSLNRLKKKSQIVSHLLLYGSRIKSPRIYNSRIYTSPSRNGYYHCVENSYSLYFGQFILHVLKLFESLRRNSANKSEMQNPNKSFSRNSTSSVYPVYRLTVIQWGSVVCCVGKHPKSDW